MTFERNEVRGTLSFFKRRDFKVSCLKFWDLGKKVLCFNSLATTKISRSFKPSVYINAVLLINFAEHLSYAFTSDMQEILKFNKGNKSFKQTLENMSYSSNFTKVDLTARGTQNALILSAGAQGGGGRAPNKNWRRGVRKLRVKYLLKITPYGTFS